MYMKKLSIFCVVLALLVLISACSRPSLEELEEWDLVWISDSSGWDVAGIYAGYIAEDTGKTVIVHDLWVGGLSARGILDALNGNPREDSRELQELASLIPDAEVVVVYGNPDLSINEENPGDWFCLPGLTFYVNNCELDTFKVYIEDMSAIYQKILELRDEQPTILRTYDAYNPVIPQRVGQTGYEVCITCWQTYNQAIHQAADLNKIPIGLVAEAWNGSDYLKNPVEMGYTRDSVHPNELGGEVIAQALRELGYEPVNP
jgi:hypothetical protein